MCVKQKLWWPAAQTASSDILSPSIILLWNGDGITTIGLLLLASIDNIMRRYMVTIPSRILPPGGKYRRVSTPTSFAECSTNCCGHQLCPQQQRQLNLTTITTQHSLGQLRRNVRPTPCAGAILSLIKRHQLNRNGIEPTSSIMRTKCHN